MSKGAISVVIFIDAIWYWSSAHSSMQSFPQFRKCGFPPCIVRDICSLVIHFIILGYRGKLFTFGNPSLGKMITMPELTLTGLCVQLLSVKARQFLWIRLHFTVLVSPPNYCEIDLGQRCQIIRWPEDSSPFPPAYSVMPSWMCSHHYTSVTVLL